MSELGVGIVGLGFMGRRHAAGVSRLAASGEPCRLIAVCDNRVTDRDQLMAAGTTGNIAESGEAIDWQNSVRLEASFRSMLAATHIDVVCVCTPTPTHVDLASEAIKAGKHVFVEKPVALRVSEIERLMKVAAEHPSQQVMPGHAMRFWPGWTQICRWIDDKRYGPVRSATFRRLGSMPAWNQSFYGDVDASGAALGDLHIHDIDFILATFGSPTRIIATGDPFHLTAALEFETGPSHVTAEAAWDHQPAFGFRMQVTINFEHATADFDSARDIPLVLHKGNDSTPIPESVGDGYDTELRAFVRSIVSNEPPPVTLNDALRAARVIEVEREQLSRSRRQS